MTAEIGALKDELGALITRVNATSERAQNLLAAVDRELGLKKTEIESRQDAVARLDAEITAKTAKLGELTDQVQRFTQATVALHIAGEPQS